MGWADVEGPGWASMAGSLSTVEMVVRKGGRLYINSLLPAYSLLAVIALLSSFPSS